MKFLISIITVFLIFSFFLFSFRKHVRLILKPKLKRDLILKIPENSDENAVNVLFLHHSTGRIIWEGGMEKWFKDFRSTTGKPYYITEQHFLLNITTIRLITGISGSSMPVTNHGFTNLLSK